MDTPPRWLYREEESRYQVLRVVPRNADPEKWPSFERSDLGQWALRLGNAVLLPKHEALPTVEGWPSVQHTLASSELLSSRAVVRDLVDWSPASVNDRQQHFAQIAVHIWPRSGV